MKELAALGVAIPLVTAALISGAAVFLSRRVIELVSIAAAAVTSACCLLLLAEASEAPLVYWFGGWVPRNGLAVGIAFVVDPMGAALAAFAGALVTAALVFSWRFFDAIGALYHSLMLVFLAGIVGLCFSGDLFNMFVFLGVLSVAAFALTGYKIEEAGPLQGAMNFALTNSIGAFLLLWGIALLYGRTGALNLAQMGESLGTRPDALVMAAFALVVAGFFIKAAIVPFHFWLADAFATAPLPVCILLGGVVSELGLYGVARVYWTVFEGPLSSVASELRTILLVAAATTAVVGAVMSFAQHHLQRMLAFSVIAHAGLFLVGLATLTPAGLSGAAVYMLADGLVKASLFMCVGILQHRLGGVDEYHLRGRGRRFVATAALFVVGALALAGLPPFGTYVGKALIEEEAKLLGLAWVTPLFVLVSALTGGALLRAAGRVFMGWGPPIEHADEVSQAEGEEQEAETVAGRERTPAVMFVPALLLGAAAFALPFVPGLLAGSEAAAEAFTDRTAYVEEVLAGEFRRIPAAPAHAGPKSEELVPGFLSVAGALGLAAFTLGSNRLPSRWRRAIWNSAGRIVVGLRNLHSGHPGDYIAWLTFGVALLGGAFGVALR
ncbi:MAG: NADH-quinone oxidoreductase subunit D [Actinomycetota bacterium]|nr:NADH-quinone oxidoreductase subunit D [Actinomycetota bacterium]